MTFFWRFLDEGIIGVNERGEVFACNRMARDITGVKDMEAIGKIAESIFPYIPFGNVMEEKTPRLPRLIRIRGVDINVAVVPVLRQGACIGRLCHPSAVQRAGKTAE